MVIDAIRFLIIIFLGMSSDNDLVVPLINKKSKDDYKEILEESFKYLPEDEDIRSLDSTESYEALNKSVLTERQRAHVVYKHFTGNNCNLVVLYIIVHTIITILLLYIYIYMYIDVCIYSIYADSMFYV